MDTIAREVSADYFHRYAHNGTKMSLEAFHIALNKFADTTKQMVNNNPVSFLKQYSGFKQRQAAMEKRLIEVERLKTPDGKSFIIPQMLEIQNIYFQAEEELSCKDG